MYRWVGTARWCWPRSWPAGWATTACPPPSSTGTSTGERRDRTDGGSDGVGARAADGTCDAGPTVVAIGGGHGLAATLRAVRTYTDQLTAIVSVADDGGSSGRLRQLLHIIPPGDLRMCLVAMAEPGSALAAAFEYRFSEEELHGHALGNLVLAGLIDGATDPVAALDEACRLLGRAGPGAPGHHRSGGAEGRVRRRPGGRPGGGDGAPTTSGRCPWCPPTPRRPRRPWPPSRGPTRSSSAPARCSPACWPPWPSPTSAEAISRSAARKVYVCNLRPQVPETEAFDVGMHVEALVAHGVTRRRGGLRHPGLALGHPGVPVVDRAARPRATDWPTIRPNWRRPCPICSDDARTGQDGLAWSPFSARQGELTVTDHRACRSTHEIPKDEGRGQ